MGADNILRIAVCDDDDADRQVVTRLLLKYLDQEQHYAKIDEYTSGEAFLASDIFAYSLVILDIFMDEMNGMETAKQLIVDHPGIQIIFCSSSSDYAVEAYDVSALHYLLKPVKEEKLFAALDFFFRAHTSLRVLQIKTGRIEESVYLSDILWIESSGHKCIVHTKSKELVTRMTLAQLGEQLPADDFVKPIRYALVSLAEVVAIPTEVLTLSDGTEVPIGRDMRQQIKKIFTDYRLRAMLKKGGGR